LLIQEFIQNIHDVGFFFNQKIKIMDFFTIQNLVLLILGLIAGFIISKLLEKSAINKSIQNAKNEANNILKYC